MLDESRLDPCKLKPQNSQVAVVPMHLIYPFTNGAAAMFQARAHQKIQTVLHVNDDDIDDGTAVIILFVKIVRYYYDFIPYHHGQHWWMLASGNDT